MATLNELRPGIYKKNPGTFGLEVETECLNHYVIDPPLKHWNTQNDGSLRHVGVEFVFKKPLSPTSKEYAEALNEFNELTKRVKFIEDSTYTSVHVHMNFINRDVKYLANFIALYVLLENVLTRYCGPNRDGNLFCLKTKDAESSIKLYTGLLSAISRGQTHNYIRNMSESHNKYSGLNVVPLNRLGSVEVRTHRGTTNTVEINRWVKILECLYEAADNYNNPSEIASDVNSQKSYEAFVNKIFGEYSTYFDKKTLDSDIIENLFYLKSIVYCVKDWDKFGELPKKPEFVDEVLEIYDDELARILENPIIGVNVVNTPTAPRRRGRVLFPTLTPTGDI